jgi:hypothetical protein
MRISSMQPWTTSPQMLLPSIRRAPVQVSKALEASWAPRPAPVSMFE